MGLSEVLEIIYAKCELFENSPFNQSANISKPEISSYLRSLKINESITTSFIDLIFDDLAENSDSINAKHFIEKYKKLLQLLQQSPHNCPQALNNEHSISKISTNANEKDSHSIMKDIQKDLDSLKTLAHSPYKYKDLKRVLPINYIQNDKRNKAKVQITLRNKFDVQECLSSIHRRNETSMNRLMSNNVACSSKQIPKDQSYSITHQMIDVFDHLKEKKAMRRHNDYLYLEKKEAPNKRLNAMTARYNLMVKKEKEKNLRNELRLHSKPFIKREDRERLFNCVRSERIMSIKLD